MRTTISAKGQITIPSELREELGLMPGTQVVFERRPGGVLVRKRAQGEHPVDRVFGLLRLGSRVAILKRLRRRSASAAKARKRKR